MGLELPIRAAPLSLARAVSREPGFAFLWTAAGTGPSYVTCHPIAEMRALDPEPSLPPVSGALGRVPRWIGLLPYECRREMERPAWTLPDLRPAPHLEEPLWLRYGAVAVITERVLVVGDDGAAIRRLAKLLTQPPPPPEITVGWLGAEADEVHRARISRAMELIFAGHIYLVNLARRLDLSVKGNPLELLALLSRHAPAPYGCALRTDRLDVVGCSPELFLDVDPDGWVRTCPIKGTRPRGTDATTDSQLARELHHDPKELAELSMVIDVERNDLSRVARRGSVRVSRPRIGTHRSVHHREATVAARLRPEVDRSFLLQATLPSGSVTGAPKVRAMEVIRELEGCRRGLYTGALGYLAHDGGLKLAMAIRTMTIRDEVGHYFSGGGIVADSDPDKELVETRWKALQLARILELPLESLGTAVSTGGRGQNLAGQRLEV